MNKQQLKLIETVKDICQVTYKKGGHFCKERTCDLFGAETSKIDDIVGHDYADRKALNTALNKLVDKGHLIKLVQNGQETKWMTVE